jgi:hypothetical protein
MKLPGVAGLEDVRYSASPSTTFMNLGCFLIMRSIPLRTPRFAGELFVYGSILTYYIYYKRNLVMDASVHSQGRDQYSVDSGIYIDLLPR